MKEFMNEKLFSNKDVKYFLDYLHDKKIEAWVAGGAITSIASGKHDEIDDYDIYFKDKYSCAEAIRYMKELNPHVAFVSDKSITYIMSGGKTKIQFIFYSFYEYEKAIFKHFDFHCCMGAYNTKTKEFVYDDLFWLNNSQRFLTINHHTEFPILTMLRLDKYKSKGYKTSRNEVLKLGLRISDLNINSWEDFKKHIGNSYGFTLADLKDVENEEFTIEKAITKLLTPREEETYQQPQYEYAHDILDFIVLQEPIEYVIINDVEYFVDEDCQYCEDSLNIAIENKELTKVQVDKYDILSKDYYCLVDECNVGKDELTVNNYSGIYLYEKDKIKYQYNGGRVLVKVKPVKESSVKSFHGHLTVSYIEIEEVICRESDVSRFLKGEDVAYLPTSKNANSGSCSNQGYAFSENSLYQQGKIAQIREDKYEDLKKYIHITGKTPRYAHTTFSGIVLEGGEKLTPYEILLYMDDFNLCFGGEITVNSNGKFSGRYNTD